MSYTVKDQNGFRELEPGDAITADVVTANNGNAYWLENLRITDESGRKTAKPGTVHRLDIGDHIPDLALMNQDGKSFHLGDFKGKAVLITFIYTRCPMPTFCPRLSSQFAKIQDDLQKTPLDFAKTHLVTISFDPRYDTPPVLVVDVVHGRSRISITVTRQRNGASTLIRAAGTTRTSKERNGKPILSGKEQATQV